MFDVSDTTAALPGSLDRETFLDLLIYREFLETRERLFQDLYGRRIAQNPLRDHIIRSVLIEFGSGQVRNLSFYQKGLAHIGSHSAVRNELARLAKLCLVVVKEAGTDRRSAQVIPTKRLVTWYSTQMPRLYDEIRRFLTARDSLAEINTSKVPLNIVKRN